MKDKILITGGAGFIGSHLTKKLLALGHPVVCLDNLNRYYSPLRKKANIKNFFENPAFKFYQVDITKAYSLAAIFALEKPAKICHLAARAGVRPSIKAPHLYLKTNLLGTNLLLELAVKHQVKSFVFASSSSVYGCQSQSPFSEKTAANHPASPYAASKKAGELLLYTYSRLYQLKSIALRLFTVYGPAGRPDMAPYLFTDAIYHGRPIKKFGSGDSCRDYTYVDDIVAGFVAALSKNFDYEIINLGSGHPTSLNRFIALIENLLGKKAVIDTLPPQAGDVPVTHADLHKAQKLLGYQPKISLEKGMGKFVDWYLKQQKPAE